MVPRSKPLTTLTFVGTTFVWATVEIVLFVVLMEAKLVSSIRTDLGVPRT